MTSLAHDILILTALTVGSVAAAILVAGVVLL